MRWWLYDGGRISGPFDKAELSRIAALKPGTPLCAEADLGSARESWIKASRLPEIAALFPPNLQPSPSNEKPGPWPPDPALRDVSARDTVEQRLRLLDRALSGAQNRVSLRKERYEALSAELSKRLDAVRGLEEKVRGFAASMGGFSVLSQDLAQARAAMAMQNRRIAELSESLKALETAPPPPSPPLPPLAETPAPAASTKNSEPEAPKKGRRRTRLARPRSAGGPKEFSFDLPEASLKKDIDGFG